jgi:hypothetical protein
LEFGNVGFSGEVVVVKLYLAWSIRRKTLGALQEQTTNSTHI